MKKNVLGFIAAATLAVLAGCATQPALTSAEIEAAHRPLVCHSQEQCSLYWRRAQAWLAMNSHMKIQIATDTVLETYNPVDSQPVYAFKMVRVPEANNSERIQIWLGCGNPFGCFVPKERIVANLKQYVTQGS